MHEVHVGLAPCRSREPARPLSLNFFFDVGAAWDRGSSPDYHRGIGAELMSEPRLGYLFGLSMRLGLA